MERRLTSRIFRNFRQHGWIGVFASVSNRKNAAHIGMSTVFQKSPYIYLIMQTGVGSYCFHIFSQILKMLRDPPAYMFAALYGEYHQNLIADTFGSVFSLITLA